MIDTRFFQHAGEGTLPLVKLAAAVRRRCVPCSSAATIDSCLPRTAAALNVPQPSDLCDHERIYTRRWRYCKLWQLSHSFGKKKLGRAEARTAGVFLHTSPQPAGYAHGRNWAAGLCRTLWQVIRQRGYDQYRGVGRVGGEGRRQPPGCEQRAEVRRSEVRRSVVRPHQP